MRSRHFVQQTEAHEPVTSGAIYRVNRKLFYLSLPDLTLNSSTGAITPSTSTPGNYKVIFNFIGGPNLCPNTDTAFVTIAQTAGGTISYPGSPYCTNSGIVNVTNNLTGTTTGASVFSIFLLV